MLPSPTRKEHPQCQPPPKAAVSAQNALRHGLTARQIVLPSESEDDWNEFRQAYLDELAPHGIVETGLALRAAELAWRLQRVAAAERDAVLERTDKPDKYTTDNLNFMRYYGAASPPEALPATLPAPAALRPITRYEAHLSRQYFQVTTRLQQLQDRRNNTHSNVTRIEIHGYPGKKDVGQPSAPDVAQPPPAVQPSGTNDLRNEPQDPLSRHSERSEEPCSNQQTSEHAPAPTVDQARHAERSEASSPVASSAHEPAPPSPDVAQPPPAVQSPHETELPNELPPALTRIPDIPGRTPEIIDSVRKRVLNPSPDDDPWSDEEDEELDRMLAEELGDDIPLRFCQFQRELRG